MNDGNTEHGTFLPLQRSHRLWPSTLNALTIHDTSTRSRVCAKEDVGERSCNLRVGSCKNVSLLVTRVLVSAAGAMVWSFSTGGYVQSSPALTSVLPPVPGDGSGNETGVCTVLYRVSRCRFFTVAVSLFHGITTLRCRGVTVLSFWYAAVWRDLRVHVVCTVLDTYVVDALSRAHHLCDGSASTLLLCRGPSVGGMSESGVSTAVIVFGSDDDSVYAVRAHDGVLVWRFIPGGIVPCSLAVGVNGVVYFGSIDYNMYGVAMDSGQQLWRYSAGGRVQSPPVIPQAGVVCMGASDGVMYCLQ